MTARRERHHGRVVAIMRHGRKTALRLTCIGQSKQAAHRVEVEADSRVTLLRLSVVRTNQASRGILADHLEIVGESDVSAEAI